MCRTDQIAICSSIGEVGYLNPKRPLATMTVRDLKEHAMKMFPKSGSTLGDIKLVVVDRPLDNDSASLSDCGIKPHTKVQMVTKVNGG